MNPDPSALLAGLERIGLVLETSGDWIAAGPSARLEDVDRIAITWARKELYTLLAELGR